MKLKKVIAIVCSAMLIIAIMSGCGQDTREVLSVNGEKVSYGKFVFFLENMKEMIASESDIDITDEASWSTVEIDNKKAIDVAKEKAVDDVVSLMVQVQRAKSEGIELTDEDKKSIGKQKNSIVSQYGGESGFKEKLKEWKISSEIFDQIMQDYMYASKLQAKYLEQNEQINNVTDEEIQVKYNDEKEKLLRDSIFVKHILILTKDTATGEEYTEEKKAEAKDTIDMIHQRLVDGEDFDTLMKEYSQDVESSYDGYSFTHGDGTMDSDFDNAAYALGVGDISEVIKTQFGYHIIKRLESDIDVPELDDVRDSVITQIKSERYQSIVTEQWVSEANVVKKDDIFDNIK